MMKNLFKQLFSFVLPVAVLVVVPLWIERDWSIHKSINLLFGSTLIVAGLSVMATTIISFIRIGKGTLAPWAPTQKLVIKGPYRYVRNPMILGVLTVILGESLCIGSNNLLIWAGSFFFLNTIYFIISEEPGLEHRFGNDYKEYKKHVSMWIPRLRPYFPGQKEKK